MKKVAIARSKGIIELAAKSLLLLMIASTSLAQSNAPADKWTSLAAAGNAARGEQVFHSVGCADCHGEDAQGMDAPALIKIRLSLEQFVHWVRNASSGMDPFPPDAISDSQLADVYAFIGGSPRPAGSQPSAKVGSVAETRASGGNPANGAQQFRSVGCAGCHGGDAKGEAGPPLFKTQKTFQQFEDFVRKPEGAMPNEFSPDKVSEEKLIDIYAFLQSPPDSNNATKADAAAGSSTPGGDAENGKRLFASHGCDKCHGPNRQSGAAGMQISTVPDSVQELIDYVRHSNGQMPAFGATIISDSELADIYAYLKSQTKP